MRIRRRKLRQPSIGNWRSPRATTEFEAVQATYNALDSGVRSRVYDFGMANAHP